MTTCSARLEDCRCQLDHEHVWHGAGFHSCAIPGCGALWVNSDDIVRIPFQQELPRHYGRPDLRVA